MVHAEFGKSHSKKLSNILVALSLVFFVGMTLAVHADGDFPSVAGFACGVKFTVTGYSGTSVLTNFPVLVRLSNNSPTGFRYDDFFRADGSDICFLDMEGNALAYDMDTWNIMGESLIWVSLPCMTNGTEFVMLYSSLSSGKSVCGDNAWADYTGVWHLGESGDGAVCVEDSSSNLLRANSSDWSQATTDGMIGSARLVADRCVKADKGIKVIETERAIGALNALDTDFSVSLWMRPQGSVTNKSNTGICYDALIGRKSSVASAAWQLQLAHNSTDMRIWASDTQDSSVTTTGRILPLEVGQWTKLDVVYSYLTSGGVAQYAVYANGMLAECGNLASVPVQGEGTLVIGGEPGSGERPFWGDMDEVRLRAFVPGPDWIKADYDTVCDTGFLTAGNVETYEELPRPEVELSIANKGASFVQFSGVLESLGGEATEASVYVKIWKASEAQPEDWTLLVSSLREGDSFRELIGDLASLTDYRYAIKVVNNLDDPYGFRVKSGSVRTSDGSADTWIDYETGYAWTYSVIANGREVEICNGELAAIVPSPVDEVTIPSMIGGMPVTSIGDYAFYECSSLAGVTIPESVVNIGYCAFRNCSSLLNVVIPAAVTNIELAAFSGCKVISSFSVADDNPVYQSVAGMILTRDGKMLVQGVNGDVTIPDGVEIVGPHSFRGCSTLTNVVFSGSVTNIASQAFYYCRGLTRVIIPGNVANIGAEAFMGCTSLGGVEIGDGVTSIGNLAFSRCSELRSVTIPSTMMSIGSSAFSSCNDELFDVAKISGVKLVDGWAVGYTSAAILSGTLNLKDVRGVADLAFSSCSRLTSVAIPSSLTYIGAGAFSGCARLQSFVVDPGNAAYKSESGLLLSKDGARLVAVPGALTRVVIPSDVTSIESYAFSGCSRLTSITLPVGLTDIGVSVFSGCSGLTSATIPDGVTSIGSSAFYGCSSLASVTIPAGVTSIGSSAFSGCSSLASVIIPTGVTSIGSSAFYGCSSLASVTIPAGVTSIGSSAFCGCSSLTSVAVPAGVTSIGDSAFSGCSSLASVTIPAGVTSIGSLAFSRCSSLTSAIIPAGVTSIGSSAFSGCSSLTSAIIPAGVTSIGSSAFSGCSRLTGMTIPDSVTSIGMYAFSGCSDSLFDRVTIPGVKLVNGWVVGYVFGIGDLHLRGARGIANSAFSSCSTLTSVTIPSNLTHIGDGAFSGCSKLQSFVVAPDNPAYKSESGLLLSKDGMRLVAIPGALTCIKIPSGVTAIQSRAFYNSFGLTSVEIPSDVISIGDFAFYACRSLKSLALPDSISVIGDSAFEACSSLTNITMSPNVTSIGRNAFYGCSYLTSIKIPSGVRSIGALTFFGCRSLTSIEIPAGVTGIGDRAFGGCQGVKSFIVAPENTTYKAIEGCLLSKDGKTLVVAPGGMESITIPDGVTSIGPYAFEGCYALSDVTIPDGVTSIGSYAFASCSALTNVAISASVTSIGAGAFSDCSSLERVTMPDGLAYIGDYVFRNCGALSSITIPDGVAGIGSEAFSGCTNLTSITIPRSVRAIGGSAFYGCHALGRVEFASFDTILCLDDMANMFPEGVEVTAEEVPAGLGFHCGEIVDDETWVSNEVHLVVGKVTVPSGVALTIETGAVVKFMSGASLIVSGSGNCTANGVVFTHVNDDTIGGDTLSDGGASVPKVDDYYASLPADCELTCEFRWRSVLHVTLAGTISADETWGGCNVYCVTGNLAVASGATLNIRPGAIVKFPSGVSLTINSGATLNAIGTRAQPIVFTSVKDDEYGGDTNGDGEDTYPWAGDWGCVRVSGGKIKADHCRFTYGGGVDGNQYGARACMFMWNGASGTFDNCLFGGSTMDGCFAQNATLRNCIFTDCDRGLVSSVGTITAINCVAAYNRIGFFAHQGSLVVYNSISSLNTESALTGDGGSRKDYNCYLGSDPKFVDPDNCDFRILEGSPCVDAAEAAYAPEMDYFGQPRVNAPDIGICEVIPRGVASDVDLAPQDVTATGPLAPGDEITVKWIVGNLGSRLVDVPWRDTVSLVSADGRAVTLGEKVSAMRIAAGGSVVCSGIFTVPALAEGVWYPKVQVNTYRDVFEGALTENNALMSVSPVELTIAAADVSAAVAGRIVAGVPTVLKLPFTEDAVNRLVRMTLPEGVTVSWGFGFMPTTGRTGGSPVQSGGGVSDGHDVLFLAPNGEQTVYVVLKSGTTVDYSLTFEDNPLVISSISPTSIPKSGTTSIIVTGAGFTPSNGVTFASAEGTVAAESVRYVNANTLVATVDCGKFTSGSTYAAETSVGVLATSLPSALTVTDADGKGEFWAKLYVPDTVRKGRVCSCYVEYGNNGNVDVLSPVLQIVMEGDGTLGYVDSNADLKLLQFIAAGENTHAGIVSPGYTSRCYFKLLSGTQNKISLCPSVGTEVYDPNWDSHDSYMVALSKAADRCAIVGDNAQDYSTVYDFALNVRKSGAISTVYGKVTDYDGRANSGYVLRLNDLVSSNDVQTIVENGHYIFKDVIPGVYSIHCDSANLCLATNVVVDTDGDVGCDLHIDVPCVFRMYAVEGSSLAGMSVIASCDANEQSFYGIFRSDSEVDFVGLPDGLYSICVTSNDVVFASYYVCVKNSEADEPIIFHRNIGMGEVEIQIDHPLTEYAPAVFIMSYEVDLVRAIPFQEAELSMTLQVPCGRILVGLLLDGGEVKTNELVVTLNSHNLLRFSCDDLSNVHGLASHMPLSAQLMGSSIGFNPEYITDIGMSYINIGRQLYKRKPPYPTGEYECEENIRKYNDFMNNDRRKFAIALSDFEYVFNTYRYDWREYVEKNNSEIFKDWFKTLISGSLSKLHIVAQIGFDALMSLCESIGTKSKNEARGVIRSFAEKNGLLIVDDALIKGSSILATEHTILTTAYKYNTKIKSIKENAEQSRQMAIKEAEKFGRTFPAYEKKLNALSSTYVKRPKQGYPPTSSEDRTGNQSKDPNEMAGPMGKGDPNTQRFVEPGQWLTYTVYYENDASATAAAQEVFVTNSLSQYLDWSTFEMGEVAFGDQIDLGLVGKQNCTNEVTMTGTNLIVRSIVDLDEEKGEVRWYMRVVDPDSGDTWPTDVTGGFLPPNDKETHCGEGHLTYRIKVRDDAPRGVRIDNSATIVFDTEDPIETDPAWWNIIATHQDVSVTVDGVMTNLDLIVGVPYGELPTPKVRAGYTFGGWYTGPNGTGRRVTAQSLVEAGDNGLYALWLTHAYTVHFNANGGEGAMSDQAFAFDKPGALDANAFARRGYRFLGWATNETGAVVYEDGAEVLNLTSEDGGAVDLFAVWQLVSMTVTFDPNGGTLGTATSSAVVTNGFAYGALPTVVREGYSFTGWTNGRDVRSPTVLATTIVTNETDHVLYAQWTANAYTVIYDANGGEGEMEPLDGTYDLVSGLASNAFSRTSYRFLGWATSADGPVVYVDGANVSNLTAAAGGTVTLYAVWELLTVEMAFDAQGGSPAPTNRVYLAEIPYGELPVVSREGYTFGGWYTGPGGTGMRVMAQGIVEFGSDGTLYANWLTNAYTVRFNANGGDGQMSDQAFEFDKSETLDSNAFVCACHDFAGWATAADGESVYVDGEIVVNLTSAEGAVVDLFATWMRRIHAVDFYADEAMTRLVESRTVGEGLSVGALPVTPASVDGYSFAGWRDMANPAAMVTADTIVAGDMKVCAVYTANTYTLFFDAAGGAVSTASKSVVFGEEIGRLPHSIRDGYTLDGWYVGDVKLTPTMVYETAGDSTATAHWTKDPDPEPEPEPEPEVVYELYSFVDGAAPVATASEYNGYLYDEKSGAVKGTIQVKVGKLGKKDGKASVKATVVLGAKKVTLKAKDKGKVTIEKNGPTEIELVGGEACEIALGADGLAGYYGAYIIDGSRNFFASKDKGEVTVVNDILSKWLGSFMVVWDGGSLSVSIAAKGKVKVSGTLADGKTKVSVSTVLLVGEEWCCVSVAAQKANLAFVLWLSHDGQTIVAEGLGDNVLVGKAGALANGAVFHVDADEFASVFGQTMLPYLPDGVPVTQKGTKWTLPKAGKVVYKNGAVDESKLGENQCGLKLTYKAKDGTFKGSFKVYTEVKGKPKATTVNVTGFLLNGVGYGTATVKGKGSVTVTIE